MQKWIVSGADRETGQDRILTVEADTRDAAVSAAISEGMLVAECDEAPDFGPDDPRVIEPEHKPKSRAASEPTPVESALLRRPVWTISIGVLCGWLWIVIVSAPFVAAMTFGMAGYLEDSVRGAMVWGFSAIFLVGLLSIMAGVALANFTEQR